MKERSIKGHSVFSENLYNFYPDDPVAGRVEKKRSAGTGIQQSDGTFTFVGKKMLRARSKCILKLPHGRLSHTVDNAYQLTIKLPKDEACIMDFSRQMFRECMAACNILKTITENAEQGGRTI